MTNEEVTMHLMAAITEIPLEVIQSAEVTEDQYKDLEHCVAFLSTLPIALHKRSGNVLPIKREDFDELDDNQIAGLAFCLTVLMRLGIREHVEVTLQ